MLTIFRHNFLRSKGQILGWGIGLALLGLYLVSFYDTVLAQREQLEGLLEAYPPELFAFFGGLDEMFSPQGYFHTYLFSYLPIVLGIFAVLAGSGLLASDEESGILDLVLSYPISRGELFTGRVLAFGAILLAILLVVWLGIVLFMPSSALEVSALAMIYPHLSVYGVMLVFGAMALFFSMLLPSRSAAAMVTGLILVASYFIESLGNLDEALLSVARFTPLHYYQGGLAIVEMNWLWFFGMIAAALVFTVLAWLLFERRDIRVGGEGGWRSPLRFRRAPSSEG
jgi:ABC-2 type transport system permease protein